MKRRNIRIFINIVIYIFLTGIIINLLFANNLITKKEKQIIKEMTENTQVTELNNQINSLNKSHEEYATNVQNYKKQIAEAITNNGVETSENDDAETMANNINKIAENLSNKQTVFYIGTISNGGTIDVSSYSGYENFTKSNFLFNNITGYVQSEGSNYGSSGSAQMSFAHNYSYNSSTGKLTFGGTYMNFNNYSWRGTGWISANVYLVIEDIS